jgi:hypothetical protein
MKLTVQQVNIPEFKEYLGFLDQLSGSSKSDDLNMFLFYRHGQQNLSLILKDSFSFACVEVPSTLVNEDHAMDFDWGISINSATLSYIIASYREDQLATMQWHIGEATDGKSFFHITTTYDDMTLPHLVMTADQITEFRELLSTPFPEAKFSLSDFRAGRNDFLAGLSDCLSFVSDDEKKNNALALYSDRMVVNDQRHIFIYRYETPVLVLDDVPVSLHKRIAKALLALWGKKLIPTFDAVLSKDGSKVFLSAPRMTAMINNATANILPPQQEDLDNLTPDTMICAVDVPAFLETVHFFSGFYKSGMDFKPIMLESLTTGLKFTLRDSGVGGYRSSNIERVLPVSMEASTETCSSTVLNDSLIKYLKTLMPSKADKEGQEDKAIVVELYMDNKHHAVYLDGAKKKIYLARLKG